MKGQQEQKVLNFTEGLLNFVFSMNKQKQPLVNPSSLSGCFMECEGVAFPVLDISFARIVVEKRESMVSVAGDLTVELRLDRHCFTAGACVQVMGDDFIRLSFTRLVPSGQASLRAFLSPKKIGESLAQDWSTEHERHFHGLGESELWVSMNGEMLFSFLDQANTMYQFIMRIADGKKLRAGRLARQDYIALEDIDRILPLATSQLDRDTYSKMGECRDIVTNFRPRTRAEYGLKQKLLKAISDHLYSTSHKVGWTPIRPSPVSSTAELGEEH